MKTVTVRELRHEFGRISAWLEAGETVQILKRGKPFARVVPEPHSTTLLGCMAGTAQLPSDLEDPLPIPWEVVK